MGCLLVASTGFNSTLVLLKAAPPSPPWLQVLTFQLHSGAIEGLSGADGDANEIRSFNSTLVLLKDVVPKMWMALEAIVSTPLWCY